MELVAIAVVVGGTLWGACCAWGGKRHALGYLPLACAVSLLSWIALAASQSAADEPSDKSKAVAIKPVVKQLEKPKNWPEGHPLPLVGSNCAACHLTAGRELTAAVINFVRSVHDLNEMTCYDCHGGNPADDVKAHYEDFGFIGTKKSTHIQHCSECHAEAAETLAAGPHHWDFSKRINTEYPLCFDCHGNHDIGNPPADFKLMAMCADCHETIDKDYPHIASVVAQNDRLWEVMRQVRKKNITEPEPIPESFTGDVASLRNDTMQVIHLSKEITADEADRLNKQAEELRNRLEKWLQSTP